MGGDGTLNDVVNALPHPAPAPLTQLAVGTANMLARELGLPRDVDGISRVVERGRIQEIDLGRAESSEGARRFLMNASVGFDSMVVAAITRERRGALGFRGYVAPTLRCLARYQEPKLAVRLDGGAAGGAGFVIASNLSNYGGLMQIVPDARCDSGHLVVAVCGRARRRDLPRFLVAGLARRFHRLAGVDVHHARHVEITARGEPVAFQADGDWRGATPVTLELQPRALRVLAPGD